MKTTQPIVGLSIDARHILNSLPERRPSDAPDMSLQADFLLIREHLAEDHEEDVQAQLVASHVAARIPDVGIIPEVDVFRSDPYLVARSLASLDILSNGRAGFAPFAEPQGVLDIGFATVGTDDAFIGEFVLAMNRLWNNWQPGALARDWSANRYVDNRLIHRADHQGAHFSIRGPLPTPTAVQSAPFFLAKEHPAHRTIVGQAAAVIAAPGATTGDFRRVLIEHALREVERPDDRTGALGVLLHVGEDVSSWAELLDLSAAAAETLGWKPRSSAVNLAEKFKLAHAAELDGAEHV